MKQQQQQGPPKMEVSKALITVNKFFDLPRDLTGLDPVLWGIEIVLQPRVKYYRDGSRLTCIPLQEEVIAFSSSNILYQQDHFTVDFNSPNTVNLSTGGAANAASHNANNTASLGSRGASMRSVSQNNSALLQSALAMGGAGGSNTGPHADSVLADHSAGASNSPSEAPVDAVNNTAGGGAVPPATPQRPTACRINNKVLLMFPTRADLRAVVEVVVGVRERRRDSPEAVRWLTPTTSFDNLNPDARMHPEQMKTSNAFAFEGIGQPLGTDLAHMFSFAEREVASHKVVQRFLSSRAGHLSITISIPHVRDDLRHAKYYHELGEPFYFGPALLSPASQGGLAQADPYYRYHDGPAGPGPNYYMHNKFESIAAMALAEDVVRLNGNPAALERYRSRLAQDAAARLRQDCERLALQFDTQRMNPTAHAALAAAADVARLMARLEAGESEFGIYRSLLLACDPSFYVRRVARLCKDYPPTNAEMENIKSVSTNGLSSTDSVSLAVQTASPIMTPVSPVRLDASLPHAATMEWLLAEYKGNEEELLRLLSVEMGPERRSATPRMRYAFFVKQHHLSDEEVRAHTSVVFQREGGHDVLDNDPDLYMHYLERYFRCDECQPRQYNFPKVAYIPDERGYFADTLTFFTEADPAKAPSGDATYFTKAQLLRLRDERMPLQLTPFERPLAPRDPSSHRVSEIDILLDKYKPEFQQIIPSIAAAVARVVAADEAVWRQTKTSVQDKMDVMFQVFSDRNPFAGSSKNTSASSHEFDEAQFRKFLTRLSDHTYISPSSLLATVIYLDRLALRYPNFCLTRHNVERLFVVMVRIASKMVDLRSVNNKNFANVFRMPTADMNFFEERMLKLMDFDFFLSPEEFLFYSHLLDPTTAVNANTSTMPGYASGNPHRVASPPHRTNFVGGGGAGGGGSSSRVTNGALAASPGGSRSTTRRSGSSTMQLPSTVRTESKVDNGIPNSTLPSQANGNGVNSLTGRDGSEHNMDSSTAVASNRSAPEVNGYRASPTSAPSSMPRAMAQQAQQQQQHEAYMMSAMKSAAVPVACGYGGGGGSAVGAVPLRGRPVTSAQPPMQSAVGDL